MEDPAIARFKEMLAKDPRSMAFAPLAEAYRKNGRLDEAVAVAEAGLKAHPGYLGGLVVLGRALFDKGEVARSFEILSNVMKENPDNYMAAKTLARIYAQRDDIDQALAAYRRVRAMMPGDREVEEELTRLTAEEAKAIAEGRLPPPPPEPPPPPPPVATMGFATESFAASPSFDVPVEERAPPPPQVVAAALVPDNPFHLDEGVRSMLGEEGGLGGEDESLPFIGEPPPAEEPPAGDIGTGEGSEEFYLGGKIDFGAFGAPPPAGSAPEAAEEPPTPAVDATPARPEIVTETLARLYAQQGAEREARKIIEKLGIPADEALPPAAAPAPAAAAEPLPGTRDLIPVLTRWLAGAERMKRR
jgi:tetratricopeptide (TPR) repeat protein